MQFDLKSYLLSTKSQSQMHQIHGGPLTFRRKIDKRNGKTH
jgi:hypothetical protein